MIVLYLVTKKFNDGALQRRIGELVDGNGYRLLNKLIVLRYLKDMGDDLSSFRCQICNREFVSDEMLDRHYIEIHPDEIEIVDSDERSDLDEPSN